MRIKHEKGRYLDGLREVGLAVWRTYEGGWTVDLGLWTHWHVWDVT